MKNRIQITYGDPYNDGHGMACTVDLQCTHTIEELVELEDKAGELTGVSFTDGNTYEQICTEYEDSVVSNTAKDLFTKAGVVFTFEKKEYTYDLTNFQEDTDIIELYLRWLQVADPKLQWDFIKVPRFNSSIGYGLFYA